MIDITNDQHNKWSTKQMIEITNYMISMSFEFDICQIQCLVNLIFALFDIPQLQCLGKLLFNEFNVLCLQRSMNLKFDDFNIRWFFLTTCLTWIILSFLKRDHYYILDVKTNQKICLMTKPSLQLLDSKRKQKKWNICKFLAELRFIKLKTSFL